MSKSAAKKAPSQKAPPQKAVAEKIGASPMMAQFWTIKAEHPDALLFFRMGDFYELFFEDAEVAAAALDIALTKRGKHKGADIPMCGVPVHAAERYLENLIKKGHRVAVCEQLEDPAAAKARGSKAVVARGVVRLVTPGTLHEERLLEPRQDNYLAALAEAGGAVGLAWVEMSTGAFQAAPVTALSLPEFLARLGPRELILSERHAGDPRFSEILAEAPGALTPLPGPRFDSANGTRRLCRHFGIASLDALGDFSRAEAAAAGALLDYLELTQKGRLPRLARLAREPEGATLAIDPASRRNLELTAALSGGREGSLLAVLDRTQTGPGARLLTAWLAAPLTDKAEIEARHAAVAALIDAGSLRADLRDELTRLPDLERALGRLSLGRGGPRDLAALAAGLSAAQALGAALNRQQDLPPALVEIADTLGGQAALGARLAAALADDLPFDKRDGGFVRPGHLPALDEERALRDASRQKIAALEARYVQATGIASLKLRHNNMLGYYVEVPAAQAKRLAEAETEIDFRHRQTMAGAQRYGTAELADLEGRIAGAAERALALELEAFDALSAEVATAAAEIAEEAKAAARLDVFAALAEQAARMEWQRPAIFEDRRFLIEGGRHPVVEAALTDAGERFVANDCHLGEEQSLWLLTGPNMAGKSTFLRQNALIAILAQMGSFVPAARAEIGLVDRVFSRVGAADDLARGRSTFMVEMVETAAILNQAGARALVILDEIGRGTATFDGLSIAWATVEQLHDVNRCRALFATHYHELTALAGRLPRLSCHALAVKEWEGEVIFLHRVEAGAADRSYGIQVARLAGLPPAVVARAQEVLAILERDRERTDLAKLAEDLPLFALAPAATPAPAADPRTEELVARLRSVEPDSLTPRQALDFVYELAGLLGDS